MKYSTADLKERDDAFTYLTNLAANDSVVEIKKVNPKRSLNQNNYLHLLLGIYGSELGYTLEEAKTLYKRQVNSDLYVYKKNGLWFLISSSDLTTDQMRISIDRFRKWCSDQGVETPDAGDHERIKWYENNLERFREYL